MKNIFAKFKHISADQMTKIFLLTVALIVFLDMDKYLYPYLDQYGLPLPSTLLTFIWLPIYLILIFVVFEKRKKRVFALATLIGTIYLAYLLIHHVFCRDMAALVYLPSNFIYSLRDEFIYIFVMVMPLLYVYAVYRLKLSVDSVEKIVLIVSMMISVPILLGNLFLFSPSTYVGWTKANLFSWFTGIYEVYHPRQLATKFFFSEGNTTGIVLFMTYPILLNMLYKAKAHWKMTLAVIVQGLAMYCLATRVATYGVLLIFACYLAIWIVALIFKKATFNKKFLLIYLTIFLSFLAMFKFTPAYVNQQINAESDGLLIEEEQLRQDIKNSLTKPNLVPFSQEYINYYSYIFVDNSWLLSIPKVYYTKYYHYRFDPKFWVDLIFEYDFYERASGRDFERIFSDYKWNQLSFKQKLFGLGYSTFMRGGITLEQDFLMQIYTHGYIGFALLAAPWLLLLATIVLLALRKLKQVFSLDILVFGFALCGGFACAYSSGHALDEIFSSMLLAILTGKLLLMTTENNNKGAEQ